MEATGESIGVLSWAFSAPAEDGVPALMRVANQLAPFDHVFLRDLANFKTPSTSPTVEARELMTTLVSIYPTFASPAQLALYTVIVARAHTALFVETVVRKRRFLSTQPSLSSEQGAVGSVVGSGDDARLFAAVFTTMRAWSRDLIELLIQSILPQLCFHDAQPHTVSTSQELSIGRPPSFLFADAENHSKGLSSYGTDTDSAEQHRDQLLLQAISDYRVPDALTRLVETLYYTTRDSSACPLLLATYATLYQMEVYIDSSAPQGAGTVKGSVLQKWRHRFLREVEGVRAKTMETRTKDAVSDRVVATESVESLSDENKGTCDVEAAAMKLRCFIDEVVHTTKTSDTDDVWSFAISHLENAAFPGVSVSTMFSADMERAAAPPDVTAALLAKELEDEIDANTLVAADHLDTLGKEDDPTSLIVDDSYSSPLCRQGALFLLADALRDTTVSSSARYSTSSTSLLLCVVDAYSVALTCPSLAGLMRHLLLLHDIVITIPKYSVDCVGEGAPGQPARETAEVAAATGVLFDSCLTRRYEVLFAVEKELLSVSALCPSDEHRRAARVIALEILERLKEEPRVRMHLSLLTLCPYPSIARFFLERLLEDWREQHERQDDNQHNTTPTTTSAAPLTGLLPSSSSPLAYMVPMGLGECMSTFLQHLTSGTRDFLDPLIVSLNFIRVSASRHSWIRAAGLKTMKASSQLSERQPQQQPSEPSAYCAWVHLLSVVKRDILPRCDALVKPSEAPAASPFMLPPLSPLDAFSLSCAVDGVKVVVE